MVQTAAFLEIVHAAIGLVSSPVVTVALQVSSRLLLVWCYSRVYSSAQTDWSLYLMVISWSLVEVPRYLFYVYAQFKSIETPYALFWLRYSLFMLLYPTGISGEVLQMYSSLAQTSDLWTRITYLVFAVYVLGSPYMIANMWGNRVRSFKKREADKKGPPPVSGLVWPITSDKTKERNTTPTNVLIWSEAVGAFDKTAQAALDKDGKKKWCFAYAKHCEKSVQLGLASPENAVTMAKAGLAAAQKAFRLVREGKDLSLAEAMATYKGTFSTGEISGEKRGEKSSLELDVPYGGGKDSHKAPYFLNKDRRDTPLRGADLLTQLDRWAQRGTVEPSAAESIKKVVQNQAKWMDLSDMYFVLLGATSAMGPLDLLLKYGANIIAVDIDRPHVWKTIISKARKSRGRVFFPIKDNAKGYKKASDFASDDELAANCGANLLDKTPEICNWVKTVCPGEALTIGNYTYLDGALHVQLSVACDAIIQGVCAERKNTAIAFLCTPTDIHVVPQAARDAAAANYKAAPLWLQLIAGLGTSALKHNAKTKPVNGIHYVDGLSIAQGQSYCLAKRLQHWRAIVARSNGHKVSSNVAPSTATESVTSNASFKAAYGGFHIFKPLEVMYQETSNAVMTALLVFDLRDPASPANPKTPLANPYQLFEHGSFHGGVWRCAYKLDTIGEVAVLSFVFSNYAPHLVGLLAGAVALGQWLVTGRVGL